LLLAARKARQNSLGESFVSDSDVGFIPLLLQMDHWRMRKRNVRALNLNPILCSYSIHPRVILFLCIFFSFERSRWVFSPDSVFFGSFLIANSHLWLIAGEDAGGRAQDAVF
jgi:hypothetical protein